MPSPSVDRLSRELRHAARRLARTPVFTLAAMLTLALAISANVAIFTIVHRVVLNPLPYRDSSRLLLLDHGLPSRNIASGLSMSAELYYQYRERARTLDGMAMYRAGEQTLTGHGVPERIRVLRTTPSLGPLLHTNPERGRWFAEEEGAPGAAPAVVLSHGLWVRRYGQDPDIVGKLVALDGVPTPVVGIMPASFAFPDSRIDAWVPDPISATTANSRANSGVFDRTVVARIGDGATIAAVRAELTRLSAELAPVAPNNGYDQLVSTATTLLQATVGRISHTLWILLASVALVLLVACANVANLFLVRSDAKQRDVAVRRALGAGFGGIAAYFFAESAWLAVGGGSIGLVLAWAGIELLRAVGPATLPRLHEVRLDTVAVACAAALTAASAILFGSIPLLRLAPRRLSVQDSGRGQTTSRARHRVRHVLMAAQVAVALVLLAASGLMLRSFQKLRAVDPGFDATSTLSFRVGLPPADYRDRDRAAAAHRAMLDRLAAIPGVTAASAATCLPLSEQGCFAGPLFVEHRALEPGANAALVRFLAVAGGYFDTMRMRLLRGRPIDRSDVERGEAVVVVNDMLARTAFPNQDPIGQRVRIGNPTLTTDPAWLTIVGVVANTAYRSLAERNPVPQMYLPMAAFPALNIVPPLGAMSYVLRTTMPPLELAAPARRAVAGVDENLALAQLLTLQDIVDRASSQTAFTMVLLVAAAGVALVLGVVGIYGATAYIVSQRTAEIGVRLALGATAHDVVTMIVQQSGTAALIGVAVGLATALAGGRVMQSLLYGVTAHDAAVLVVTTLTLLAVALVACWLPARRAARLNPLDALRVD
ncbi:MAG TPA: ABC transporter permease [Vicinamibacterales bacterium]|jgi:predicted permease